MGGISYEEKKMGEWLQLDRNITKTIPTKNDGREEMVVCKHCKSTQVIKNGFVRKKQRYLCKNSSRTFVIGNARKKGICESKESSCSYSLFSW